MLVREAKGSGDSKAYTWKASGLVAETAVVYVILHQNGQPYMIV